jgi:hypothetical protein
MPDLALIVVILTALMAVHLVEEIKAGFRRKFPLGIPPRWLMVVGNAILYIYALMTAYFLYTGTGPGLTTAWIYGLLVLGNAIGHLTIIVVRKKYFPGGYSAMLLLPAAVYLLLRLFQV